MTLDPLRLAISSDACTVERARHTLDVLQQYAALRNRGTSITPLAIPGKVRIVEAKPVVTLAEIRHQLPARNPVIDTIREVRRAERRKVVR